MRFEGKRQRRPRVLAAAFGVLVLAGATAAVLVLRDHQRAEAVLPWLVIGGMIGFYALMMLSMISRRATLEVDGRLAQASWRAAPLRIARVEVGRWVLGGVDTPTGAMLVLVGDDGARVRVGGRGHDGAGYAADVRARSVDLAIGVSDFDALAAALGVARGDDALAVELIPSSQSAGGLFRTMAPWIATIALLGAFGVTLALTGLGDRLTRMRYGPAILGGVTVAIAIGGLVFTIARSVRVKPPAWIVRAVDGGLALARGADGVEVARAPWAAVRAEPRRHLVRSRTGTTTVAALVLAIGERELIIGAYDSGEGWPDETPRVRRAPPWLAGGAQWAALIAALRDHGAFRPTAAR